VFEQLTPLGELHVRWTGGTLPAVEDEDADPDRSIVEHVEEEYS
jgi:segregation and condensation protein A